MSDTTSTPAPAPLQVWAHWIQASSESMTEGKYTGFYGIKSDLVNVSTYGKEKITFNPDRGGIVFFCHDCKRFVETDRPDAKKMKFICKTCKGKKISYGTEESLKEHYKRVLQK